MQVKCQVYLCGICKCYCGNKQLSLFYKGPWNTVWNTVFLNCHNLKIPPTFQVHCHVDENFLLSACLQAKLLCQPVCFPQTQHTHTHTQWEQGQCSASVSSSFCHFSTSRCVHMSHDKPQTKAEPIVCLPNEVKVSINTVLEYNLEMEII